MKGSSRVASLRFPKWPRRWLEHLLAISRHYSFTRWRLEQAGQMTLATSYEGFHSASLKITNKKNMLSRLKKRHLGALA